MNKHFKFKYLSCLIKVFFSHLSRAHIPAEATGNKISLVFMFNLLEWSSESKYFINYWLKTKSIFSHYSSCSN